MQFLLLLSRSTLAAMFLVSAATKSAALRDFDRAVEAIGMVPGRWARPVGLCVIALEGATAALLAFPATASFGLVAATLLLAAFTLLIGRVLGPLADRGGNPVECACFGASSAQLSPIHLVRNCLLLLLALVGLGARGLGTSAVPTGFWSAAVLALGLAGAVTVALLDDLAFAFSGKK